MPASDALRVGLLINPVAGMGGRVGLKGSDGAKRLAEARRLGAKPMAAARALAFLRHVEATGHAPQWLTCDGGMGADCFAAAGIVCEVVYTPDASNTTAADTRTAAAALLHAQVDVLVFVGGDGTARDLLAAVADTAVVLGVPAGVKMHSGVFAVSPVAAAKILARLASGGLVASVRREVRDFVSDSDTVEQALTTTGFGELRVPEAGGYLQHTKVGGKEQEPLAVQEICAHVLEHRNAERICVLGAGGTCLAVKQQLGFDGTLRGVDVLHPGGSVELDVNEARLLSLQDVEVFVSFAAHQGVLFGRGNQMFSPTVLRRLLDLAVDAGPRLHVLATRTKLDTLQGRPLIVDTGDVALDRRLSGLLEVLSGYEDHLLYRVARDYA
ncbi:MAG: NAD(+)/NADH kinase [Pseudomonadota bacterium]